MVFSNQNKLRQTLHKTRSPLQKIKSSAIYYKKQNNKKPIKIINEEFWDAKLQSAFLFEAFSAALCAQSPTFSFVEGDTLGETFEKSFPIQSLMEDILYLLKKFHEAFIYPKRAYGIITEGLLIFIKLRTGKPLVSLAVEALQKCSIYVDVVTDFLVSCMDYFAKDDSTPTETDSFAMQGLDAFSNGVDKVSDMFSSIMKIKDTALFAKFRRLILYFLSFGVCTSLSTSLSDTGFISLESVYKFNPIKSGPQFVVEFIDAVIFVLKKGIQVIRTGDISCIYHSGDTYGHLFDQYNKLKTQTTQLHNPELFGFNISSYQRLLDDTIESFQNISKHMISAKRYDKELIAKTLNELTFWRTQVITKKSSRNTRRAPFAVLIHGESGVGKTYMKEIIFNFVGRTLGLDVTPEYCFTRSPGANFWDGFRSSMWCVILDDVGFPHPNKCPNGDETYKDLIQICNNQPFGPDQAALEDKGRTPMMARLVVATTNIKNLNAATYFSHASAAQRRLPIIITPVVKPEFATGDGMLDGSKVPPSTPGQYDDYWYYDIDEVRASKIDSPDKYAKFIPVRKQCSLKEMLLYLKDAMTKHELTQDKYMKAVASMQDIEFCDLCQMPKLQFCECPPPCEPTGFAMQGKTEEMTYYNIAIAFLFHYNFLLTLVLIHIFTKIYKLIQPFRRFITWLPHIRRFVRMVQAPRDLCAEDREYMVNLGNRVQAHIVGSVNFAIIAKALVACSGVAAVGYTWAKLSRPSPGSMKLQSTGYKPVPGEQERSNPWVKDNYITSSFDLSCHSKSVNGLREEDFLKVMERNCGIFEIFLPTGFISSARMFCIRGNVYATNNHLVPSLGDGMMIKVTFSSETSGISENFNTVLCENQVVRLLDRDLCVFTICNTPPRQGIFKYLPKNEINIDAKGAYIGRKEDGTIDINVVKRVKSAGPVLIPQLDKVIPAFSCQITRPTIDGECGTLLYANLPSGKTICGYHILGKNSHTYALSLTQQMFETILNNTTLYTIQGSTPSLSSKSAERKLGPLHAKSPFRYIQSGIAHVYGSYVGFRPQPRSRVVATPMASYLSDHGYKIRYGKPVMAGWEPWYNSLKDMVAPVTTWNHGILEEITKEFISDIRKGLTSADYAMVHVYDDDTTLNGAPGVSYVDKINRNTSAGAPWNKIKRHFLTPQDPIGDPLGPMDLDFEITYRIHEMLINYNAGERSMPVFTAHLKDEAVSYAKIAAKKTRIFCGAPLDFTFMVRKYMLGLVRLIQNKRCLFESAPGTIAQSREWHNLYLHISRYGEDRIIAGDYSKFDKKMSSSLVIHAFAILRSICKDSGNYDVTDLRIFDGIANDIMYPLVDFNGDLVNFHGTNPSGHPLTVIINGLVNSLMMRYAYRMLNPIGESASFKDKVSLMTYGDDNICSVSPDAPWFNHTSISIFFGLYDIGYTMADKSATSVPYIHMSEATFLKRSWRMDTDIGLYMAPLDHDSIEKMLMVWVASKTIGEEQQCIAVVSSAMHEYFFYGKEVFAQKRNMFIELISKLDLGCFVEDSTLPTWEALCQSFDENSQHVEVLNVETHNYPDRKSVV